MEKRRFKPDQLNLENLKAGYAEVKNDGRDFWEIVDGDLPVLIFSGYNGAYYRVNSSGYTNDKDVAWKLPLKQAFEETKHCGPEKYIRFEYVQVKKEMVAGFLFSKKLYNVLLIKKQRPEWMKGLLNGIGGKIELNETPGQAMVREFEEETGLIIPIADWKKFAILQGPDWTVHFFMAIDDNSYHAKTDEEVVRVQVSNLWKYPTISNIQWLIPLALDRDPNREHPLVIPYTNQF